MVGNRKRLISEVNIPKLSTEDTDVQVVLLKFGTYKQHMKNKKYIQVKLNDYNHNLTERLNISAVIG